MSDIHHHTFAQFWDVHTAFGDLKVPSTLGGFNIDFLVFLSFFPYGKKKVVEEIGKCIGINIIHYYFLIQLNSSIPNFKSFGCIWVNLGFTSLKLEIDQSCANLNNM